MTSEQYRDAIARLNLSQVAAGKFLLGSKSSPRHSRKWAAGHSPIPRSVELLLRVMVKLELTVEDFEKL